MEGEAVDGEEGEVGYALECVSRCAYGTAWGERTATGAQMAICARRSVSTRPMASEVRAETLKLSIRYQLTVSQRSSRRKRAEEKDGMIQEHESKKTTSNLPTGRRNAPHDTGIIPLLSGHRDRPR